MPAPAERGRRRGVGMALLVVTSVLWSLSGVAVKLAQMDPLAFTFYRSLSGAVALALVLPLTHGRLPQRRWMLAATPRQLTIVLTTGVVQMAAPYVLFQLGLRHVRAVTASLLVMLEPVLNPVWVALFTHERPDAAIYAGGAAILVAMLLEVTAQPAPAPPPP